jgi:iron complex transport system permease protein
MIGSLAVLVVAGVGGLAVGSSPIPVGVVVDALTDYDPTNTQHVIVVASRMVRPILGLVVGVALGVAGALMQAVTRNPLAEPGILGVNAGAAIAVVIGISSYGVTTVAGYLPLALAGAAVASVAVYLLGTTRRSAATPVRLALAGAAIATVLAAITRSILLSHEAAFNSFRYWAVGSLQGRDLSVVYTVLPLVVVGVVLALVLAPALNAMALGEQTARSLGARPGLIRGGAALSFVLLAGAATAAAGPIAFVGLAAPHIVRAVVGPDQRLILPGAMVVGPAFLVAADTLGRWLVAPAELQTGIAAAILGGPIFVALVRSRRMAAV